MRTYVHVHLTSGWRADGTTTHTSILWAFNHNYNARLQLGKQLGSMECNQDVACSLLMPLTCTGVYSGLTWHAGCLFWHTCSTVQRWKAQCWLNSLFQHKFTNAWSLDLFSKKICFLGVAPAPINAENSPNKFIIIWLVSHNWEWQIMVLIACMRLN